MTSVRRAVVVAIGLALPMLPSGAAVAGEISSNVADHVLTVTGTNGADDVAVVCEAGEVTVNGSQPAGGPEACADLRRIQVFGRDGDDRIGLGEVSRGLFDRLDAVNLSGQNGDDTLFGSDLADTLTGEAGADTLRGGGGPDELVPGQGGGEVAGGQGRDVATFTGSGTWAVDDGSVRQTAPVSETTNISGLERVKLVAAAGNDILAGAAFSGSLLILGKGGNDILLSGSGRDDLRGGGGNDRLEAASGNDVMSGNAGDDLLNGGEGNDELRGGPGTDLCDGGPGADSTVSC